MQNMITMPSNLTSLLGDAGTCDDDIHSPPLVIGHADIEYADARDILTKATGFMSDYDYTLNPYSGCSFGCTYCYAAFFSRSTEKRGSWGRWVLVKQNAVEKMRFQRSRGRVAGKRIYMSTVTDPYQPIERKLELTRRLLKMLADCRPKLVVQTRSPDVVRDIDLFRDMADDGGQVQVNLTVTTDDDEVRRAFEPHCPNNQVRLKAAAKLREAGVQTCITMTPLLWTEDAGAFADQLLATEVERFIVQPFHFQKGQFVRGTRDAARRLMEEKLAKDGKRFPAGYQEHYNEVRDVLRDRLPSLGEGKEGFRPPF